MLKILNCSTATRRAHALDAIGVIKILTSLDPAGQSAMTQILALYLELPTALDLKSSGLTYFKSIKILKNVQSCSRGQIEGSS